MVFKRVYTYESNMAAKNRINVCFIDVLQSDTYQKQICDLPFLLTSLPSPEAIWCFM